MSDKMKQSLLNLVLWSIITIFFLILFFGKSALSDWGDNSTKTVMLAILFLIGFSGQLISGIVFRERKNKIIRDERDTMVQNKAISGSFIVTLVYVFALTISLYVHYEDTGLVPVGWLWFIAYSLILVANLTASSFSVFYYSRGGN